MATEQALIALGANLGDPVGMLQRVLGELSALGAVTTPGETSTGAHAALSVSDLYRSAPIDADGPDYYNAVARLFTDLPPFELLERLQAIETAHGRVRSHLNAPRTLDLDLLMHGQTVCDSPTLTLPHPRMHLRAFVLRPLLDLGLGHLQIGPLGTVTELEALTRGQRIEKMPSPWVSVTDLPVHP